MTDTSSAADIQAILADLQAEIRRHRDLLAGLGVLEPPDPLAPVRQRQWVNPHLPIGWPKMPKGLASKLAAYAQKIVRRLLRWYINPIVEQQNAYNAAVADLLAAQQAASAQCAQRTADLVAQIGALEGRLQRQQQDTAALAQRQDEAPRQWAAAVAAEQAARLAAEEEARLRVQRLELWRRGAALHAAAKSGAPGAGLAECLSPGDGVDYYALGARYRNAAQMAERLGDYDDLWMALAEAQRAGGGPRGPVLDLGAGRGELVAHLAELGLAAYGIDLDADAVAAAQAAGRDVRLAEATAHLAALPDGSLAAITMIQVIEHLSAEELLRLVRACACKLSPGGLLLAETLNPTCLWALANWYLMDPSHRTPLHPELARFLFEQAGLGRIAVRPLHPVPEAERLRAPAQGAVEAGELAAALRHDVAQLNQFLYGPQDYAIIAYRVEA